MYFGGTELGKSVFLDILLPLYCVVHFGLPQNVAFQICPGSFDQIRP